MDKIKQHNVCNVRTVLSFNEIYFQTRYIAFNPMTYGYRTRPSLRVELYGCKRGDLPTSDVSTKIETDIEVSDIHGNGIFYYLFFSLPVFIINQNILCIMF